MEAKQGVKQPGHCKAAAQRIYNEAEIIATRLAEGQTCWEVAQDYHVHYPVFCKHASIAIGMARWQSLVRPGLKRGHTTREVVSQAPEPTKPTTGPRCWYCCKPIAPGTLKCPNCGTLL